jgi:DNA-directed RNA polymerase specialized sigma24 family protein
VDAREERFRRLYDTGRQRVIAYAMRRTSSHEDTADVVAETFAIAWRRIDVIPGGEREVPWLFAVARRVIANRLRGNSTQSVIVQRLARQLALAQQAIIMHLKEAINHLNQAI